MRRGALKAPEAREANAHLARVISTDAHHAARVRGVPQSRVISEEARAYLGALLRVAGWRVGQSGDLAGFVMVALDAARAMSRAASLPGGGDPAFLYLRALGAELWRVAVAPAERAKRGLSPEEAAAYEVGSILQAAGWVARGMPFESEAFYALTDAERRRCGLAVPAGEVSQ